MADKNKKNNNFEALYQWVSYDLQSIRGELMNELKISSAQIASMYERISTESNGGIAAISQEIRYSYKQNQNIYEGMASLVKTEIAERLNSVDEKLTSLEKIEAILSEISDLKYSYMQMQTIYEGLSSVVSGEVVSKLDVLNEKSAMLDTMDATLQEISAKLADGVGISEEEAKKVVDESISVHSQQVLDAIAAIPVAENVDYALLKEEIGDKLLEILNEVKASEPAPAPAPAPACECIEEAIANAVAAAVNVDAIAEAVAAKVAASVDYNQIADLVVEKLAAKGISADVVLDNAGIDMIAEKVAEKVDDNVDKIVNGVADELRNMTLVCEYEEVEEETVEEPVVEEAPVEEPAVEEVVEEPVVEEVVEEIPAEEPAVEEVPEVEEVVVEFAATASEPVYEEGLDGELIDAETGLVVRLKRSFTAKMKQSDEKVKAYYSDIKNELTSYKKINSNVSWHGDRFNFGRDTVAKIGINGKTLCFYIDLDPNDPELKQTVYHQKDVSSQKAYESTPFMVKVKSDAALKKALRLVSILAEKREAEKVADFEPVDYVLEFAYESTKSLFEAGYIKATKEKKVDFNF